MAVARPRLRARRCALYLIAVSYQPQASAATRSRRACRQTTPAWLRPSKVSAQLPRPRQATAPTPAQPGTLIQAAGRTHLPSCPRAATYVQGQEIDIALTITANHGGRHQFAVCPQGVSGGQSCFDNPANALRRWVLLVLLSSSAAACCSRQPIRLPCLAARPPHRTPALPLLAGRTTAGATGGLAWRASTAAPGRPSPTPPTQDGGCPLASAAPAAACCSGGRHAAPAAVRACWRRLGSSLMAGRQPDATGWLLPLTHPPSDGPLNCRAALIRANLRAALHRCTQALDHKQLLHHALRPRRRRLPLLRQERHRRQHPAVLHLGGAAARDLPQLRRHPHQRRRRSGAVPEPPPEPPPKPWHRLPFWWRLWRVCEMPLWQWPVLLAVGVVWHKQRALQCGLPALVRQLLVVACGRRPLQTVYRREESVSL